MRFRNVRKLMRSWAKQLGMGMGFIIAGGCEIADDAALPQEQQNLPQIATSDNVDQNGDDKNLVQATHALKRIFAVPHILQRNYPGIRESACGPTSVAMLLRYFFPNSYIDVPEIYHAGTQTYRYNGPFIGFRLLSWALGDPGNAAIPSGFLSYYYSLGYSGAQESALINYLNRAWGIQTATLSTIDQVYQAIYLGPLLVRVYAHGNTNWGHYIVMVGIDDKGTTTRNDDIIYINDPYNFWGSWDSSGFQKAIPYPQFFVSGARYGGKWFRSALKLTPQETSTQLQRTVIVDTGHNSISGNASRHLFQVDDPYDRVGSTSTYTWFFYYGDGDWLYPRESGHAARWTPYLTASGCYEVSPKFRADSMSGSVTYGVYNSNGSLLYQRTISQHSATPTWTWSTLGRFVLSPGAYVRAFNISANTNIDSVKFKYLGSTCP